MTDGPILVSGAGIAGPALAWWLLHQGVEVVLVERAPTPRTAGYIIDFWGAGYDLTERMGLLPEILRAGYRVREVRLVNRHGRRVGGFNAELFRAATLGRYTSLSRGELSAILLRSIAGRAELLFDESIVALARDHDGVNVRFERSPPRRFAAVIGADGLHSRVRMLAFGPERQYERFLGYIAAAFQVTGYRPRDEDVYVAFSLPGRQVARFSMRDDRTMVLFVVADPQNEALGATTLTARKALLRRYFGRAGWECDALLEALDGAADLYWDRVSQIHLRDWSIGRVALVGDAACAPSLLAGQGSALAIMGAYVLAGELGRAGAPAEAFAQYEARLRSFMETRQQAAIGFARSFAPRTRLGLLVRNTVTHLLDVPVVARWTLGSGLLDRIELPDYGRGERFGRREGGQDGAPPP